MKSLNISLVILYFIIISSSYTNQAESTFSQSYSEPVCTVQYRYNRENVLGDFSIGSMTYQRIFYDTFLITSWHTGLYYDTLKNKIPFGHEPVKVDTHYYDDNSIFNKHRGYKEILFDRSKFKQETPIVNTSGIIYNDSIFMYNVYLPIKKSEYNDISTYLYCEFLYLRFKLKPKHYNSKGKAKIDYLIDSLSKLDYTDKIYFPSEDSVECVFFHYNFKYGRVHFSTDFDRYLYHMKILYESPGCDVLID